MLDTAGPTPDEQEENDKLDLIDYGQMLFAYAQVNALDCKDPMSGLHAGSTITEIMGAIFRVRQLLRSNHIVFDDPPGHLLAYFESEPKPSGATSEPPP